MTHNNDSTVASFGRELPGAEHEHPTYGILTRTLIHSPVVKQIIPARIRGKYFNDVVFVAETYIELYLLNDDGKLRRVATKSDFQADIRHAKVFATATGSVGDAGVLPDDVMAEDTKGLLPPHILALTLDSGHMGFLYAVTKGDEVEFVMSTRRIDTKGVHPKNLGKSLAFDPKSRCLGVTAYQDAFRLFALYETDELERQLQAGIPLNPIKEERTFNVPGVILHMEFLYPAPSDPDHVILILFIVDSKQKFRLMLYEWWASKPLTTAMNSGQNGLLLDPKVSIPLHIIPLLVVTSFLIISEDCIYVVRASDIISGRSAFMKLDYLQNSPDRGRQSLVTSWARPLRTPSHTQTMDDLYLAMEDGDIYFVEVNSEAPNLVELMNKAGHLDCAIGSAFAALDYGLERNDLVIAGGEMSSGGIYLLKIEPSSPVSSNLGRDDEPKLGETVANWSPVFDFDLINPSAHGHAQGRAVRDRMYACTGRGEHGAIAEIRYGIHGLIQSAADYMPGIRNIWVLPGSEGTSFFLLCSFPDRSTLCLINEAGEWEDVSESDFLDMSQTTLAAAAIGDKSAQITPKAVNINLLKEKDLSNRTPTRDITMFDGDANCGVNGGMEGVKPMWSRQCGSGDLIVAAAIRDAYLVIAVRSGVCIKMTLAVVLPEVDVEGNFLEPIGSHIELQDDPSFVSIIKLSGQLLAAVGTRDATIQFYLIDPSNGLIPALEQSMLRDIEAEATTVQRDLFICESSIPIMSATSTQLLCGLRDGTLVMFNATISSGNLQLERKNEIQFGPIPVQALPHVQREDLVLVLAGPELYRFKMTGDEVTVSQIVFEGTMIEPALVAVSQIDYSPRPEAYIVCATKDQIFMAEVGHSENVCVRRLPVSETPRRLIYYKPLNILIVAISKAAPMEPMGGPNTESRKRGSSASLCFLNPRTGDLLGARDLVDSGGSSLVFGKENEQIYGLSEWHVEAETKDGRKTWKFVAICTGSINASAPTKGRVMIISVWQNASGRIEVKRRHQIPCDAPVYSVAPYGKQSIVYCAGNKLYMRKLNNDAHPKKLEELAEFKLRSPAVQITVNEPYINCSCASDSLCIIKFEEGKIIEAGQPPEPSKLHAHYSDEIARNGFSHYSPLENLFIVSDKQYGIAGLWQPPGGIPDKRNTGSLTTLFDTEITSSVSRLRGGSLRPPWHANKPRPGVLLPDKDIIGSGVDGSIFHLTILSIDALRLLRYIQGIYTAQTEIYRHHYPPRVVAVENTRLRADVDGDTLLSVIKLGEKWLREAVENEESESPVGRGGVSFGEMVEIVLGPGGDVVVRSLEYVKGLLEGVVL